MAQVDVVDELTAGPEGDYDAARPVRPDRNLVQRGASIRDDSSVASGTGTGDRGDILRAIRRHGYLHSHHRRAMTHGVSVMARTASDDKRDRENGVEPSDRELSSLHASLNKFSSPQRLPSSEISSNATGALPT
jgi:hypothetical protein